MIDHPDETVTGPPAEGELDRFGRTPEQVKADTKRLEAELAREKLKHPDPTEPLVVRAQRVDNGDSLETTLKRIKEKSQQIDAERQHLVCYPFGDDDAATDACEAAEVTTGEGDAQETVTGAYRTCRWVHAPEACPRARQEAFRDIVHKNLSDPPVEVRVPPREATVILDSVRRHDRVKLVEYDTLRIVRSALARRRIKVPLENGAEVRRPESPTPIIDKKSGRPNPGVRVQGAAYFIGTEVIVILGGNQGRGKSLAVCYAIARMGGMYTHAPDWTRPKVIDVDDAIAAPVLVIDQFGREHFGDSKWALSQLENVLDKRQQYPNRVTFLAGNFVYETFVERLKETTIPDRLSYGVFVEFGGESIRAEQRAAALKEQP